MPQLPVVAGRLCIFNRWTAGIGQFTENVRLIAPDQTTVVSKGEMKFELRDPRMPATGVMVFGNVKFEAAGTYFIEVLVDDVMNCAIRFRSFSRRRQTRIRPQPPAEDKPS